MAEERTEEQQEADAGLMMHNASGNPEDKPETEGPCNERETILFELLDAIDTASDMFKPSDEAGYKTFYNYAMARAAAAHGAVWSDGYKLLRVKSPRDGVHAKLQAGWCGQKAEDAV